MEATDRKNKHTEHKSSFKRKKEEEEKRLKNPFRTFFLVLSFIRPKRESLLQCYIPYKEERDGIPLGLSIRKSGLYSMLATYYKATTKHPAKNKNRELSKLS